MTSVGSKISISNSSKERRVLADDLVSKVPAMQVQGPEFRSPAPMKKAGYGSAMEWQRQDDLCNSLVS